MADCPSLPKCPFFNDRMANRPAMTAMLKRNYCQTDNTQCARWIVSQAKGGPAVPPDLYPNELERAEQLVR
jgi:hypothetical protein